MTNHHWSVWLKVTQEVRELPFQAFRVPARRKRRGRRATLRVPRLLLGCRCRVVPGQRLVPVQVWIGGTAHGSCTCRKCGALVRRLGI